VRTERFFLWLCAALLIAAPALAQQPSFRLPAACVLGETCWIINYVDADPEKDKAADFRCGALTYDDHNGTDLGLADIVSMEMGVDVLAAAPGKVLRVRDGTEDKPVTEEERQQLLAEDKGCGNGVFIDHGGGWQTIYCHMKKDSLKVKPGAQVKAGDALGLIGMSGIAEFPHVHLGVFKDGKTIDPFTGHGEEAGCGKEGVSLWDAAAAPEYEPVAVYAAGFKDGVPDFEAVKIDAKGAEHLPPSVTALTFWATIYGAALDDRIVMEITGPAGESFAKREIVQEKTRAQQFYFVGRKTQDGLPPGTYTGHIRLERGAVSKEETRTLLVR